MKYKVRKPTEGELEQLRQLLEEQTDREIASDFIRITTLFWKIISVIAPAIVGDCCSVCTVVLGSTSYMDGTTASSLRLNRKGEVNEHVNQPEDQSHSYYTRRTCPLYSLCL